MTENKILVIAGTATLVWFAAWFLGEVLKERRRKQMRTDLEWKREAWK